MRPRTAHEAHFLALVVDELLARQAHEKNPEVELEVSTDKTHSIPGAGHGPILQRLRELEMEDVVDVLDAPDTLPDTFWRLRGHRGIEAIEGRNSRGDTVRAHDAPTVMARVGGTTGETELAAMFAS